MNDLIEVKKMTNKLQKQNVQDFVLFVSENYPSGVNLKHAIKKFNKPNYSRI